MAYTAAALAEGAGSSLSVPLVLEGEAEAANPGGARKARLWGTGRPSP